MRVAAGGPAGDPPAGPVGCGAATVEGGGELPGDEGALVVDRERPHPVDLTRLVEEQAALDVDPGAAQGRRSPAGDRVRVRLGEDHPPYAGGDQRGRARAGAAGVVAGFEGHHGRGAPCRPPGPGQGIDLGVRTARSTVVALGHDRACVVDEDAADSRVRTPRHVGGAGELEGTAHRAVLGCGERHARPSSGRGLRGRRQWPGHTQRVRPEPMPCVRFPSGLSPSVQEFHLVNRSLAANGSRTFTAGSELHRPQSTRAWSTRQAQFATQPGWCPGEVWHTRPGVSSAASRSRLPLE